MDLKLASSPRLTFSDCRERARESEREPSTPSLQYCTRIPNTIQYNTIQYNTIQTINTSCRRTGRPRERERERGEVRGQDGFNWARN